MPRLLRITTVPISLTLLLKGQFQYMREHGFEVITMSANGKEAEDVVNTGTRHIVVPLTRKITPFHDLRCLWQLVFEIKKLKPDIVHTHTPKAGLLGMLAAWICRVPIRLHTVAGLPLMEAAGFKRLMLEIAEKITYSCAQRVYPNSAGLKTFIEEHLRLSKDKVKIIGNGSSNGIDIAFFSRSPKLETLAGQLRIKYGIKEHDFIFSFAGRIVRDKGIVELVNAFQELSKDRDLIRDKRIFLLFIGNFEENLDPLPSETLQFLKTDKHVILAGFQNDIRAWIIASDAFVFPSYREGFPNVVMQSSLLGVPCIVSDINGCNEIVKDGSTGILVKPKDIGGLVHAMRRIMKDGSLRKQLAKNAHEFVANNFPRELVWAELRKEYERLLNKNAVASFKNV